MVKNNDLLDDGQRRPLLHVIFTVSAAIIAEAVTMSFLSPTQLHRLINLVFNALAFAVSPFVPLLMAGAFGRNRPTVVWAYYLPATGNLILSLLSPFYGFIYYYSLLNEYYRGPFFPFYVFSYLFGIVYFLGTAIASLNIFQNKNKAVLLGLVTLTLLGTSIQIVWSGILSSWPTVTLVIILGYAYYNELLEQHDILTGLLNRRAYTQHLSRFAAQKCGTIILFDVDDFKHINDQWGHPYGDRCLQLVAAHIRESFAPIGFSYRIGGDEFCVLSKCMEVGAIQSAKNDFLEKMDHARSDDPRLPWVSFGHALYDSAVLSIGEATENADRQLFLYKEKRKGAKQAGRN